LEQKNLIRKFPDKGRNVRSLNRLMKKSPDSVAALKRRLIAAWSGLQQHVIGEAINQCCGRMQACVRADG